MKLDCGFRMNDEAFWKYHEAVSAASVAAPAYFSG